MTPTGEYDGSICAAAAMRPGANIPGENVWPTAALLEGTTDKSRFFLGFMSLDFKNLESKI